jgi:hypothetical protein
VNYRLRRDYPTKCTELYTSLFFLYDGSYMFWQNNAILMERLCSFLSHFSVNMVGDNHRTYGGTYIPACYIQRQYGRRQVTRHMTEPTYRHAMLLHVSAKQCNPQGATMFLSEPPQYQYGRRQVTGHMTEPTYRHAIFSVNMVGDKS